MENHEKYLFNSIIKNYDYKKNVINNDFFDYHEYKKYLLNKFEDYSFDDLKGYNTVNTDYGEIVKITDIQPIMFNLKDEAYRKQIKKNLKLIPGIGVVKESKLKSDGFNTIDDLINHEKYCDKACEILEDIDNLEVPNLVNLIKNNTYTKECKLNLINLACLFDKEDFKFMDIETLGLSNVPIILIGIAEIKNNSIISTQYLVKDLIQEPASLKAYMSHLDENSAHVTFNGKYFDVPYIKNRMKYYRMPTNKLEIPHFDLINYARYLWKDSLPNCKLQTIEKHIFGIERECDVIGAYIPDYYNTYLIKNNIGPLIPIIDHNRQDIISLASFLEKMYREVNGD